MAGFYVNSCIIIDFVVIVIIIEKEKADNFYFGI